MKMTKHIGLAFVSFLLPFAVGTGCAAYVASHFIKIADQRAENVRSIAEVLLDRSFERRFKLSIATGSVELWQQHNAESEAAFYRLQCLQIGMLLPEVEQDFVENGREPAFVASEIERATAILEQLQKEGRCHPN